MDLRPLLLGALFGLVLAAAVLLIVDRRRRRQIDQLLRRLETLETSSLPSASEAVEEPSQETSVTATSAPSADVLAGRSSFVRRAVQGEGLESLAAQAIARVHVRLGEPLTPAELAEALHLSLRTLERGLGAALGCTPRELISAMKMREARRLLDAGHLQVSEVAYRLGYASPAHFSRAFHRFYRIRPSDRRRRQREGPGPDRETRTPPGR